ncbi:MAG TPA: VTT domain-containing protein [Vicinamibacterales bacterium]
MTRTKQARRAREYISLAIVASIIIAALLLARHYDAPLRRFIEENPVPGVFLYVLLNILDAMVAPGATLPLIPIAAKAWGRIPAALVTTVGWTTGSLLGFLIARRWGASAVRKITSYDRVKRLRKYIPDNLFWSVVLLRTVLPMDVISYVLGLFTEMSWQSYLAATSLGLLPSAILLAYLGKLPHAYEIFTLCLGAAVVAWVIMAARRKSA